MSQKRNFIKPKVISDEAMCEDTYRKIDTSFTRDTVSSFTRGYHNDNWNENFISFKTSNMPKLRPFSIETNNSIEQINEKEKEAEIWNGPLSRYNTYTSNKTPKECMEIIGEALNNLEKEKLVDWEISGYSACGRMYYKLDISEYMMNVYIASDNRYKSVIEISRLSGDTFVHDEFLRRISKYLQEKDVLSYEDEECPVDFNISLELESLDLDKEFSKEMALGEESISDGETTVSDISDITSAQQLGDELIDVVTDRGSYRETFRHSSGMLCQELTTNPQLLEYVAGLKNIIQRLMKPLTEDLYDPLIIRNILQVIKQLLQFDKIGRFIDDNCSKEICDLKKKWENGIHHQTINVRFGRSQQIEKVCFECLDLLQKRS